MTKTSRFASLDGRGQVSAEAVAAVIAEMSADEIRQFASEEARAELAAPKPNASDDEGEKEKKKPAKDDKKAEGDEEGAKPAASVGDRSAEVFASEYSTGRERLAADCLAAFPTAKASEIVTFLAKQSKPTASDVDDDKSQGREMLDQMKQQGNKDLGAKGADDAPNSKAKIDSIWDTAREQAGV